MRRNGAQTTLAHLPADEGGCKAKDGDLIVGSPGYSHLTQGSREGSIRAKRPIDTTHPLTWHTERDTTSLCSGLAKNAKLYSTCERLPHEPTGTEECLQTGRDGDE